jgi:hypothetical protein
VGELLGDVPVPGAVEVQSVVRETVNLLQLKLAVQNPAAHDPAGTGTEVDSKIHRGAGGVIHKAGSGSGVDKNYGQAFGSVGAEDENAFDIPGAAGPGDEGDKGGEFVMILFA